ncbi:MAG TPA: hypothetical protein VFG69_05765 [Nannocystaceae bacterium]|nr:hypothetical protein [Nannocystaceae bacterium]
MTRRSRAPRRLARALMVVSLVASVSACDGIDDADEPAERDPDARLRTHAIAPSTPTPQGLAYLEAVADAHAQADAASRADDRAAALRQALALPVPAALPESELLRLELAARLCETLAEQPGGVPVAIDLLAPMLDPERSLPVDRASARALVVLGDLAVQSGDDALAAGSYMRAIKVMSLLRQELER